MSTERRTGILLVNLGTPDSPTPRDVRRYLAEFLSDPRVLTLPGPLRWLLLHGVILRVRPKKSAAAYEKVWQPDGSPLMIHGRALAAGVASQLGDEMPVALGMRYGRPSIGQALGELHAAGARRIVLLPLFPQFSEAVTGSVLAETRAQAARLDPEPQLVPITEFHDDPGFVATTARLARPTIDRIQAEHLLLSFHGLPESQVRSNPGCLERPDCCEMRGEAFEVCYRAQCFATSRAIVEALDLEAERVTVAFQSRVGLNRWIQPFTDEVLADLRERGIRRLAVACPSFVADCLETLEEIDIRLREQWVELGGEDFALVPCVNAEPDWVAAVTELARGAASVRQDG